MEKKYADIMDVAAAAGVSAATVSRSFNHPQKLRPDTRRKIERAIEATGYIRNRAAQAIHGKKSGTIGLIVPTLDNAIFANLIQSFAEEVERLGFTMLVTTHGYDLAKEYQLLRSMLEFRTEGIALIGVEHLPETYALLARRETPAVTLWNYARKSPLPCVGADNEEAGRLIADHVASLGVTSVATLFPDVAGNDRASARLKGVLSALKSHGIEVPNALQLQSKYSIRHARERCRDLLSSPQRPEVIICGNDVIGLGAIYEAQALGVRVPQDMMITGFGDFSGAADVVPSLTTVRLPAIEIGVRAAGVLVDGINGVLGGVDGIKVPGELVVRESTNRRAVS